MDIGTKIFEKNQILPEKNRIKYATEKRNKIDKEINKISKNNTHSG